ncbi:7040_t:CDS:1, partial [Gigaspora margarita]
EIWNFNHLHPNQDASRPNSTKHLRTWLINLKFFQKEQQKVLQLYYICLNVVIRDKMLGLIRRIRF